MTNIIDESALVESIKREGLLELVKYVMIETAFNGGSTRNLRGESIAEGYAVGGQAKGLELTPVNDHAGQTVESILEWHGLIREWIGRTPELTQEGFYLGAWKDTVSGNTWFDVSRVFTHKSDAIWDATERGELAIWDLGKSEEIRIEQDKALVDAYVLNTTGIAR